MQPAEETNMSVQVENARYLGEVPAPMTVGPVTLQGQYVRMEPLSHDDRATAAPCAHIGLGASPAPPSSARALHRDNGHSPLEQTYWFPPRVAYRYIGCSGFKDQ